MMNITESIINRISQIVERPVLVGVCGRAGSGKSTLTGKIKKELQGKGIKSILYSGDWRFKLDSEGRKVFIRNKWFAGLDEYLRAVNQFNWWDFEKIFSELDSLKSGNNVVLENVYDRETGRKDTDMELQGLKDGVIFYENCILGGLDVLNNLNIVVLLNTPEKNCFDRLADKDAKKRSFPDILARQLVTIWSENFFFKMLLEKFSQKLLVCNSEGRMCDFPMLSKIDQIPVPVTEFKKNTPSKGTIFCDLDGVLIKHVQVPLDTGEDIEILDGSPEKLKEFREKGYYVVLVTSRPHHKIFGILQKLKGLGMEFDQVISDLPLGVRHLINDNKDDEIRAVSHPLKRNEGIKNVKIN